MSACKEGSVVKDLPPSEDGSSWEIVDVQGRGDEASVLLKREVKDKWMEFAFLEPDGKVVQVAQVPEAAQYAFSVAPLRMPSGKRCAVYVVSGGSLHLACDDGTSEDSGIKIDGGSKAELFPIVDPGGDMILFGANFASLTMVMRLADGTWGESPQAQSSISWPTSTAEDSETTILCFINSAGHAVVRSLGRGEITSSGKATRCNVAVDASSVHVLLDTGFATIPLSAVDGGAGTFDVKSPLPSGLVIAMASVGGKPFTVMIDLTTLKVLRVALATGVATDLGTKDNAITYRARFDEESRALTVVSLPSLSGIQTVRIAEYCTADW